jgi:hypothetical protein
MKTNASHFSGEQNTMRISIYLFAVIFLTGSVIVGNPSKTNAATMLREVSLSVDVSKKAHFRATENGASSGDGLIADVTFVYSFDDAAVGGDLTLLSGSYTLNTSANPGMDEAFDITGTLNVDKNNQSGGSNIQIVPDGSAEVFLIDLAGSASAIFGNGSTDAAFSGLEVYIDQNSGVTGQGTGALTNTLAGGGEFDDRRFTLGFKLEKNKSFLSFDLADLTDAQHKETKLGFFWAGEEKFVTGDDFGVLRGDKNVNATGKDKLFSSFTVTEVPEPATIVMLSLIPIFVGVSRRSRKSQR